MVSKVANFSIDLPEAAVAIQVSGSFGSRQEEAQRLGRLLRPKQGRQKTARFYTVVSRDTVDADFAQNRQRFLAEQGYAYRIVDAADLCPRRHLVGRAVPPSKPHVLLLENIHPAATEVFERAGFTGPPAPGRSARTS